MIPAAAPAGKEDGAPFDFPAARRLKKRPDFRRVQSLGVKVHTRHFLVLVGPSPDTAPAGRLGITVTRKVGNAVARNHVKRRVREAYRTGRWAPKGADLVVIAKRGAPLLNGTEVSDELARIRVPLKNAAEKAASRLARPARR